MKRWLLLIMVSLWLFLPSLAAFASDEMTCWFPPGWKNKQDKAAAITEALSGETGIAIRSRVADSYPQILESFSTEEKNMVYVGSFVQAILRARDLGTPLVQCINGKEFYSGILVYPEGEDPQAILEEHPAEIAFTLGASSGESTAKAATGGRAAVPVNSHKEACSEVVAGRAKGAVVKNWWWEANKEDFPGLATYEIPRYSKRGNPDNVLSVSKSVSKDVCARITSAAMKRRDVFGAAEMPAFDPARINFSLWLMQEGGIDPMTYQW